MLAEELLNNGIDPERLKAILKSYQLSLGEKPDFTEDVVPYVEYVIEWDAIEDFLKLLENNDGTGPQKLLASKGEA
jgi:hypothetical protein